MKQTRWVALRAWLVWMVCVVWAQAAVAAPRDLPDFTELAEKQGVAVVNISSSQTVRNSRGLPQIPGLDEDDPMYEFFKRFAPRQPGVPREQESRSLGSGFIISQDGFILTNAHVVDQADEVTVRLPDKREFKARVVGADRRTDVALIKIEATGLPRVTLGDPNKLKVGEWVVAIGSPFGFDNSVTAGIVSAKGRSLPQENFVPFIQTDAAVNPGNSGGPLFNMRGEVVGINSQIYSRTGGFMGLSFAIPIDIAMDVQTQLRATGRVSRGRIGVVIQEVTRELADSFGLSKPQGALVSALEKGGPAEKAGIETGDIILKFEGKPVAQSSDLPRMVGATRPGARSVVQVWRNRTLRDISVQVAEIPDDRPPEARKSTRAPRSQAAANRLGLVLSEPTPEQRKEWGVAGGVVVEEIKASGVRTELRVGDVILSAIAKGAQTEIKTVDQFNKLVATIDKSQTLTLLVRRGDMQTFVTVRALGDAR